MKMIKKIKSYLSILSLIFLMILSVFQVWKNFINKDQVLGENDQILDEYDKRGFETVLVKRVIDGDTIELADGRKVRYIGIDTPETKHPSKGQQCFGQQASEKNQQLVEGKTIYLEKDVSETDRYGRLLRYVWVDNILLNEQLVVEGYAFASSFPPDVKYQAKFRLAQQEARKQNTGLWGSCDLNDVDEINQYIEAADANLDGQEAAAAPEGCLIKGNISDNGKLYHLPECPAYANTKIDLNKGEQWFCTEAEATAAGWLKANNCE